MKKWALAFLVTGLSTSAFADSIQDQCSQTAIEAANIFMTQIAKKQIAPEFSMVVEQKGVSHSDLTDNIVQIALSPNNKIDKVIVRMDSECSVESISF